MPRDAPVVPQGGPAWSVRWVALHLIEEAARHAGHADIVRESIDGATMYELVAGAGGLARDAVAHALAARLTRQSGRGSLPARSGDAVVG